MTIYSAALLVKLTAKHNRYNMVQNGGKSNFSPKKEVSEWMQRGQDFADRMTTSEYYEMQGKLQGNDDKALYFTFDEIKVKGKSLEIIEYKIATKDSPKWYLQQSLLQVAFYQALATKVNSLKTAAFVQSDNPLELDLNDYKKKRFILQFGETRYVVNVKDSREILNYYFKKVDMLGRSFGHAQDFDEYYEKSGWKHLKQFFNYRKEK
jgi:hypothetical protein